jgi:hypothetical protein
MLAKNLIGPHFSEGPEIENPSWAQIENAIRALNNDANSSVMIGITVDHEPPWLGVVGGDGKYAVSVWLPDETNRILINQNNVESDETTGLVTGGQFVPNFPKRQIVDLETALKTAKTFAESGKLDESFIWIED